MKHAYAAAVACVISSVLFITGCAAASKPRAPAGPIAAPPGAEATMPTGTAVGIDWDQQRPNPSGSEAPPEPDDGTLLVISVKRLPQGAALQTALAPISSPNQHRMIGLFETHPFVNGTATIHAREGHYKLLTPNIRFDDKCFRISSARAEDGEEPILDIRAGLTTTYMVVPEAELERALGTGPATRDSAPRAPKRVVPEDP